jgi:hypothetical protein
MSDIKVSVRMSEAIVEKQTKNNVISLNLDSNVESIIAEISSKSQKGTKLLSLTGVLSGPKDMSSDKKKYLLDNETLYAPLINTL